MQLIDERNCIIKTPAVTEYLHHLVHTDPMINSVVSNIQPDPQIWGSSGLHFAAQHIATAEPVLLKLNVAADQLWWTHQLAQTAPELLPNVFATGEQVSGEQLGWIISERVHAGLHPGWGGREFDMLLAAGVQFQIAAGKLATRAQAAGVLHELRVEELAAQIEQGVQRAAPGPADQVLQRVFMDWAWVTAVSEIEVCHGDLHMANALCRTDPPNGEALLIDYHPTRMPWVCEPAKPEILNAEPTRLGCRGLVTKQAAIRARLGLSVPSASDLARLQAIVLGWWALQMWGYIGPAPDPNWRATSIWHAEIEAYITAAVAND